MCFRFAHLDHSAAMWRGGEELCGQVNHLAQPVQGDHLQLRARRRRHLQHDIPDNIEVEMHVSSTLHPQWNHD